MYTHTHTCVHIRTWIYACICTDTCTYVCIVYGWLDVCDTPACGRECAGDGGATYMCNVSLFLYMVLLACFSRTCVTLVCVCVCACVFLRVCHTHPCVSHTSVCVCVCTRSQAGVSKSAFRTCKSVTAAASISEACSGLFIESCHVRTHVIFCSGAQERVAHTHAHGRTRT